VSIVGLRSYEYQQATDLDESLRKLVDQIKEDPAGKAEGTRELRQGLALELSVLAELLEPLAEDATILARQSLRLPVPVLRQLRCVQVDGVPMRDALRTAVEHLRAFDAPLDGSDFSIFNKVLDVTSTEASDAFDRVMNR
jgi:hypothetical protein